MDLKKLVLEKIWCFVFENKFFQNIISGRYVSFLAQLGAPKALNPSKTHKEGQKGQHWKFPPEDLPMAPFFAHFFGKLFSKYWSLLVKFEY